MIPFITRQHRLNFEHLLNRCEDENTLVPPMSCPPDGYAILKASARGKTYLGVVQPDGNLRFGLLSLGTTLAQARNLG